MFMCVCVCVYVVYVVCGGGAGGVQLAKRRCGGQSELDECNGKVLARAGLCVPMPPLSLCVYPRLPSLSLSRARARALSLAFPPSLPPSLSL